MSFRLVMLGDIVGTPGRQAVAQCIGSIRKRFDPDLVLANAENAANGSGLTPQLYEKLCKVGVDAMTLGDHAYRKKQITNTLETKANIIRPANLPPAAKGRGWMTLNVDNKPPVMVITVLGRLFMNLPAEDPFRTVQQFLASLKESEPIVLVEIHAEATSEKQAMGWYFNGLVSAVIGTHTHVPTADARILPPVPIAGRPAHLGGTAYISDIGMCGPHESILGRQIDRVLTHMTTSMPAPFDVADQDVRVNGIFLDIDTASRRAVTIERIEMQADLDAPPFVAG